MATVRRSGHHSDEFLFESKEVVCHCGLQASRRISRTSLNPGRSSFVAHYSLAKDATTSSGTRSN
ncbi:hypothetical protein LINPERHAP2_LOCUS940 [Linum perenne]